mgnify:CR=1 FL=1
MSRAHLLISGRVQGVTFRASTKSKAESLALKGWVRNTEDGKVEAVIEGEKDKIKKLIDWARQGPTLAKVEDIKIEWEERQNDLEKFQIKR